MSNATRRYRDARDQLLALRDDHPRAVAEFRWPDVGDRFNWAHDWFDAIAVGNSSPAIVVVEENGTKASHSFDDVARRSNQVARWLLSQGIGRGDAVMVMLGNQIELWDTMLAIMKIGAVILPTTTSLGPRDLADRIERAGVCAVICASSEESKFDEVQGALIRVSIGESNDPSGAGPWLDMGEAYEMLDAPVEHPGTGPRDRLLLYFTSGTTNKPKLVEHTQYSYPVGHLTTMFWLGLRPGDVHLNISSPGWAKHAWSCFFAPWIAEATIFIYNYERFDANAMLNVLRAERVTSFCAPPTVWRMLINTDLSGGCGSLRELVAAGEPLNPEVIGRIESAWGLTIRDGYGQTETTASVANTPSSDLKRGSMGRALPGVPVILVDPVTDVVIHGPGEGEICLDLNSEPPTLMTGYQGDPERNALAMSGGRYHTGDVASIDLDGFITYIGRTDDVFKASDYKISPFELESALIEHPAVAEAAVVPALDAVRLAVPKAYIALAPGYEPTRETAFEILKFSRQTLAPFLRVRRVEFFDLPKTISGKIRRVELREREVRLASTSREGQEWRDDDFPELKAEN